MQISESDVLNVSDVTRMVSSQLQALGTLWIEAEIVQFNVSNAQHWYFDIKDPDSESRGYARGFQVDARGRASTRRKNAAVLSCTMFKNVHRTMQNPFLPKVGDKIRVQAKGSLYQGRLQLNIQRIMLAGDGERARKLAALKQKLHREGLFDIARKRQLPRFPRVVGIATSRTSAALQDMLTILRARMPSIRVILAHCTTEGAAAAPDIARAIQWLNADGRAEVLLIGRGGGSADSLSAFDEEIVVRAVANSRAPTVVAVGHEPDHCLADLVADLRSATPTHAAEDITKQTRMQLLEHILGLETRALQAMRYQLEHHRAVISRLKPRPPSEQLTTGRLRLDQIFQELSISLERQLNRNRVQVNQLLERLNSTHPRRNLQKESANQRQLAARLHYSFQLQLTTMRAKHKHQAVQLRSSILSDLIGTNRSKLVQLEESLHSVIRQLLERKRAAFINHTSQLNALSPLNVLQRGYAVAMVQDRVVTSIKQLRRGTLVELRVRDGQAKVKVVATADAVQIPLL